MASLGDASVRADLAQRLGKLTPATRPKWGKLDAPRLLCHLNDSLAIALGEVATESGNKKLFQHFPLKHLVIYVVPFPKNVPAAPEFLATAPGDFEADRQQLLGRMQRLAKASGPGRPLHPLLGRLTAAQWKALQGKHIEHHLRQFGC